MEAQVKKKQTKVEGRKPLTLVAYNPCPFCGEHMTTKVKKLHRISKNRYCHKSCWSIITSKALNKVEKRHGEGK